MPRRTLVVAVVLSVGLTAAAIAAPPAGQRRQNLIDQVAAGQLSEAQAAWWGFDATDATACLQAAIDSGVPRLIVADMGTPWVVTPLRLRSDQEIVFETGVVLLAKRGEFHAPGACLVTAANVENVTLRGYGATFRMWRADYDDPDLYQRAEWRHCLSILSSKNVQVLGLTLTESGGDGIYLGTGTQWVSNRGILIKDVVCEANYRQGISVITADGLRIENTVMRNTRGTPPQAGIDFEPNHPEERLNDVVLRDCLTKNNASYGYVLAISPLTAASAPLSMRFENCRSVDDAGPGFAYNAGATLESAVGGTVDFLGCRVEGSGGAGLVVSKPAARGRVHFVDGELVNTASKDLAPFVLRSGRDTGVPAGGVELTNLRITDGRQRPPVAYIDYGGVAVADVTGDLVLVDEEGDESTVALTPKVLAEWMPQTQLRDIPRLSLDGVALAPLPGQATPTHDLGADSWPWQRRVGRYVVWAEAGQRVRFLAEFAQVGHYGGTHMPVTVTGPDGQVVHETQVPFQGQAEVSFAAARTGVYTVAADAGGNRLRLSGWSAPAAITGGGAAVHMMQFAGTMQIYVPPGTTVFSVRLWGEGTGEAVQATLLRPDGQAYGHLDDQVQTGQFAVDLDPPSTGQIWTLRTEPPSHTTWEDFYVDVRGVPPLLVPERAPVLVPGASTP